MGMGLEQDMIYIVRILLACACGAAIGIERESRVKVAGLRTHILISMSAALMMIISKYGFSDVVGNPGMSVDVSRVAAGIITGVGILSGGIIFIGKRGNVSGLTTAAGIWATIGIGMALGAGMYVVGIAGVVIVEGIQFILHRELKVYKHPMQVIASFKFEEGDVNSFLNLEKQFELYNLSYYGLKMEKKSKGNTIVRCNLSMPEDYDTNRVIEVMSNIPETLEFEIIG